MSYITVYGDCSHWHEEEESLSNRGEALCRLQENQWARGYKCVELVLSFRGWSVRYRSGLDNRSILCYAKSFEPDSAIAFAQAWVDAFPTHREVVVRRSAIERAENMGYDQSAFGELNGTQ